MSQFLKMDWFWHLYHTLTLFLLVMVNDEVIQLSNNTKHW